MATMQMSMPDAPPEEEWDPLAHTPTMMFAPIQVRRPPAHRVPVRPPRARHGRHRRRQPHPIRWGRTLITGFVVAVLVVVFVGTDLPRSGITPPEERYVLAPEESPPTHAAAHPTTSAPPYPRPPLLLGRPSPRRHPDRHRHYRHRRHHAPPRVTPTRRTTPPPTPAPAHRAAPHTATTAPPTPSPRAAPTTTKPAPTTTTTPPPTRAPASTRAPAPTHAPARTPAPAPARVTPKLTPPKPAAVNPGCGAVTALAGTLPWVSRAGRLLMVHFHIPPAKVLGRGSRGTAGSDHPKGLALDLLMPGIGDQLADYVLAHRVELGVTYVIWRQRYNDGRGWQPMEDRGSITANHYDHVHVSFRSTGC